MEVDHKTDDTFHKFGHDDGGGGEVLRSGDDARVAHGKDQCGILDDKDEQRDVLRGKPADGRCRCWTHGELISELMRASTRLTLSHDETILLKSEGVQ